MEIDIIELKKGFFIVGFFFLIMGMSAFGDYFHTSDILIDAMRMGEWIEEERKIEIGEFKKADVAGNVIGGYEEQQSLANAFYLRARRHFELAFGFLLIALFIEMNNQKVNINLNRRNVYKKYG